MIIVSDRQKQIIDAFLALIQESPNVKHITLMMIAKKSGLSRQSIYEKHFHCIDDIINLVHHLIDKEIETKIQDFTNNEAGDLVIFLSKEILPLLYQKRDWLKALYGNVAINSAWFRYLQQKYIPLIKCYFERRGNKTKLPDDFLCNLVLRQILAHIASWMTSETVEPVSLFQKKFIYLLNCSTQDLLKNSDTNLSIK